MIKPVIKQKIRTWKDMRLDYFQVQLGDRRLCYANTNRLSAKRVNGLLVKEPTTIAWMDTFKADEVFFDVGANVGMYSIYAAVMRGCPVYAFEPEALNYAELNKNIYLNGLHGQVTAYCVGISERAAITTLYLSDFIAGFSHHDVGVNRWEGPVIKLAPSQEARLRQGCLSFPLDDLAGVDGMPVPCHIKIDVDGLELAVLKGALKILTGASLKTVLVEVNLKLEHAVDIMALMKELGWQYSLDQVTTHRDKKISHQEWHDWVKNKKAGYNVIYFKDGAYRELFRKFKESWQPEGS